MESEEWAEKYRPRSLEEIVGHRKVIEELKKWAESWQQGIPAERAVILYGRPGVGKTTAAHALARSFGWDVIELNASDARTAEVIERVAGSASQMSTFEGSGSRRLIILDEADNLHGTADRGGAKAIIRVLKNTHQPIVLIANEYYDMSKTLRESCRGIKFTPLRTPTIAAFLKKIAAMEHIRVDPQVIEAIALHSNGDMRAAINDFQAIAQGREEVLLEDLSVSLRDSRETVFQVISKIFKSGSMVDAYQLTFQLDETPEDLIHWVDENLPLAYLDSHDLLKSFEVLSRADVFLGRTRRRQNYRMWKHASLLMSGGIAVSKSHVYRGFKRFQSPSLWRRMALSRSVRGLRDSVALKIGRHCHVSGDFARAELIDFLRVLMQDEACAVQVAASLDFSLEEIAYLLQSKTTSRKVKKIHESARALSERLVEEDIALFGGFGHEKREAEKPGEDAGEGDATRDDSKPQSTLFDF